MAFGISGSLSAYVFYADAINDGSYKNSLRYGYQS